MESLGFIQWYLENLNYGTITLMMAIESSFLPLPSELVIPPAAYMAAEGKLNIYLVILFGTIGANIGALFNYFLAYTIGRPLVYRFSECRVGRMCLLSREKVERAERYFDKHGAISTFIGRLLPVIRHLISIPAGLAKMKLGPFILFTTLGAALWNVILAAMGYFLQSRIPLDQLYDTVKRYSSELSYIFVALVVAGILFLLYRGFWQKKPTA